MYDFNTQKGFVSSISLIDWSKVNRIKSILFFRNCDGLSRKCYSLCTFFNWNKHDHHWILGLNNKILGFSGSQLSWHLFFTRQSFYSKISRSNLFFFSSSRFIHWIALANYSSLVQHNERFLFGTWEKSAVKLQWKIENQIWNIKHVAFDAFQINKDTFSVQLKVSMKWKFMLIDMKRQQK